MRATVVIKHNNTKYEHTNPTKINYTDKPLSEKLNIK